MIERRFEHGEKKTRIKESYVTDVQKEIKIMSRPEKAF